MTSTHSRASLAALAITLGLGFAPRVGAGQDSNGRTDAVVSVTRTSTHMFAPRVTAVRTTRSVTIDGRLDEAAWAAASPATDFTQMDPLEGAPATERTSVRLLYDDGAIYVGARMSDSGAISSRLGRRDSDLPGSDWFAVSLDAYHDHLSSARFAVNPAGVVADRIVTGFLMPGGDATWDPVWEVQTSVDKGGWTAEMRIPLSQLRFGREQSQTWGIQLDRRIGRKNEYVVLAFTPRNDRPGVARYGHLDGIAGVKPPGQQIELLPYALGKADYTAAPQNASAGFANPYRDGSLTGGGVGADIKYRPTSNITIDAAVNPDFGQVEVDPAVINLSAFETRFQEKRPFFVEGSELFRFGNSGGGDGGGGPGGGGPGGGPSSILYSRRVGRSPQLPVPSDAAYSNVPQAATILGAAKMTMRSAGGWSVGLMEAVTQREYAATMDSARVESRSEVEPLTNYFAGRVRRDFRSGQTGVGVIGTSVNRDLSDSTAEQRLRSAAYAGGLDFRHEWNERRWSFNGYMAGSYIRGAPSVMISAQRSSSRYFQRPDADYVEVDSQATDMAGYSGRFDIGKRAGTWRGNVAVSTTSPRYEINDIGFQTSADRVALDINLNYEQNRPGKYLRRWSLRGGPDMSWNYGWDPMGKTIGINGNGQFNNFWNFGYNYNRDLGSLDDRLTRGGVLATNPAGHSGSVNLSTDNRRPYTGRISFNASRSVEQDWRASSNLDFGMRPGTNVELQLGPNVSRSRTRAQYLTSRSDTLASATYGRRYVFGDLLQTQLSLELRLNVTFRPNLSLEMFAQPLLSSGDYSAIKELQAPRTFAFSEYGSGSSTLVDSSGVFTVDPDGSGPASSFTLDNPDFDVHSLRGSSVLRWEWRPGSTIYFVWQQNRSQRLTPQGDAGVGAFALRGDARDMMALRPDNVFMVKASFWMSP